MEAPAELKQPAEPEAPAREGPQRISIEEAKAMFREMDRAKSAS